VRFFEQAHIKDIVSYLRITVNPRDELAWMRVLKLIPGIGNKTAARIFEAIMTAHAMLPADTPNEPETGALIRRNVGDILRSERLMKNARVRSSAAWQKFVTLLELLTTPENRADPAKQIHLIMENGYEQYLAENFENAEARSEDIAGLSLYAKRYANTEDLLSELALLSTERFKEPQALVGEEVVEGGEEDELLTLTSVHQAKGLEWHSVFIIWAAEGKFPSPRSLREIDSEEEERRLWYVALTRAKNEL